MGRIAIEMMKSLDAIEMTPRLYLIVFGFINIWKEPWQAGQQKHVEAYNSGVATGDMEYAFVNINQYAFKAIYGCGENVESLSQNMQAYSKRAFQCGQRPAWLSFIVFHQLTLDLMGIEQNAFLAYSDGMTEDSCFTHCRDNKITSMCRLICCKKKYVAFLTGNMDTSARMFDLYHDFAVGPVGRLVNIIVSVFIDGLIGFFFARKHGEDEVKWTSVGLDAIQTVRKWVESSDWNFANKLYLLEAEYFFLRGDDDNAMARYTASVKAAREHRFIHEEGLAEEKHATYCLHKGNHDDAMGHFLNAKKCYEEWGARALVHRIDEAIAILLPLIGTC